MTPFQDIIFTQEEGIATITLNRPHTLNALTNNMIQEWVAAIEEAKKDPEVKVLVVTGAGRGFSSGADMRQRSSSPGPASQRSYLVGRALKDFYKPYIGAINGPAVAAGMNLASMCDIRIASEQARFGMVFVSRLGITPGDVGAYYLPRIVGVARAAELIWTGKIINAEEALAIGYVSRVVPQDQLMEATRELALELARGPALAIQLSKRLIYRCLSLDLEAAVEAHYWALAEANASRDSGEGRQAWEEKRAPLFEGR